MKKFRILAFSDYRVQSQRDLYDYIQGMSDKPDVIVYAGDDVNRFEQDGENIFENYIANYTSFGLFGVIGNDSIPEDKKILSSNGVHDLNEEPMVADEFIFFGIEGGLKDFPFGSVLYSEDEITNHLEGQFHDVRDFIKTEGKRLEDFKLVLVSHNPPFGVLDLAMRFGKENIGSKAILDFIKSHGINLNICGHVHLQGGRYSKLNDSTIVNVASHDKTGSKGRIGIIDIIGDEIEVSFIELPFLEGNSLLNLYSTRESTLMKLRDWGFNNLGEIRNVTFKDFILKTKLSRNTAKRIYLNARALEENKIFLLNPFEFDEKNVGYFDIELGQGILFLISFLNADTKKTAQFFADNNTLEAEKRIVIEFLEYLEKNKIKKLYCYSRIKFDFHRILDRIEAHKINRNRRFEYGLNLITDGYDIYWIIKHHIVSPSLTMKLKDLGTAFGYKLRQYPDVDTWNIGEFYAEYLETKDEEIAKKMFEYNEDDVLVLDHIITEMKRMDVWSED